MSKMSEFNTVQYCLNNNIPCFTFYMDSTKQVHDIPWKTITPDNFRDYVHEHHNGFSIVTGFTHIMVDIDLKHNPPQEICDFLIEIVRRLNVLLVDIIFGIVSTIAPLPFPIKQLLYGME